MRYEDRGRPKKYLFSVEVDPYIPNKQCSIINNRGGSIKNHYSRDGNRGVIVIMTTFSGADMLKEEFDWVKKVYRGP